MNRWKGRKKYIKGDFKNRLIKIKNAVICIAVIIIMYIPMFCRNGRFFSITLPEFKTIQPPAPKNKLIKYMNRKYKAEFHEYQGSEYLNDIFAHYSANYFEENYNGIVVYTNEYPGHYFYVCDYYGFIHDDYGCHTVYEDAEKILYEQLDKVINEPVKLTLHPDCFQEYKFGNQVTSSEYLKHGTYTIKIYIEGNGENSDSDFEQIIEIIRNYWESDDNMIIYYVDTNVWNAVDPSNFDTYKGDVHYNKKGWGYIFPDGELRWNWISD